MLASGGEVLQPSIAAVFAVAIAGALCAWSMAAIVVFDSTVRLIPRHLCRVLACAGAVLQFVLHGAAGFAAGAFYLVVVMACAFAIPWLTGRIFPKSRSSIGGGDVRCMAALCLATGAGAPAGIMACFISAAAWSISARLRKRLLPQEPFAFAPFLAIWLTVGLLAST